MSNFKYTFLFTGKTVEAVQFKTEDQDLTRAWPRWFIDLLIDGKIERNAQTKQWFLNRERPINDNDWVIQSDIGGIAIMNAKSFNELFRPAAT